MVLTARNAKLKNQGRGISGFSANYLLFFFPGRLLVSWLGRGLSAVSALGIYKEEEFDQRPF